jgi:tetratricopeptide (TPR) repeat protein
METMLCTIPSTLNTGLRRALSKTVALSGLLAALLAVPAYADEAAEVSKLLRGGQYGEALTKADAFLVQRPRDAQMRFLKGVIFTEQNKSAEAIAVFTKLTEDFPELPEPYNNLAVLYASGGQYDKARAALDMAIRTNPSYATAYENLGDIHAKLASQAYDKALQLDSANSGAKSKLTLLRSLAGNMNAGSNPKVAAAPVVTAAAKAAVPPPVAPAVPKVAAAPIAPAAAKPASAAPLQITAATPDPAKAKAEAESKPVMSDADREDVLNVVISWAKAWSTKDVKSYLGYYANDFKTPNGESHKAWADERHNRIADKGHISVKVESARVTLNGNTATVVFRQIYQSDHLKTNSRKTLVLSKQGGKWQIKQERTGN